MGWSSCWPPGLNGRRAFCSGCINAATARQVMIANAVSWVIAVLFAFWINRKMVFQVKGGTGASVLRELGEFALGRVLSFALFEEGMAYLLKLIGVSNVVTASSCWWRS